MSHTTGSMCDCCQETKNSSSTSCNCFSQEKTKISTSRLTTFSHPCSCSMCLNSNRTQSRSKIASCDKDCSNFVSNFESECNFCSGQEVRDRVKFRKVDSSEIKKYKGAKIIRIKILKFQNKPCFLEGCCEDPT